MVGVRRLESHSNGGGATRSLRFATSGRLGDGAALGAEVARQPADQISVAVHRSGRSPLVEELADRGERIELGRRQDRPSELVEEFVELCSREERCLGELATDRFRQDVRRVSREVAKGPAHHLERSRAILIPSGQRQPKAA